MKRRRKTYREKRKPFSQSSLVCIGVGGVALMLFIIFIAVSAKLQGNTPNILAATSLICMILSVIFFIRGLRNHANENFEKITRWLGMLVPGVAMVCWIGLYMVGMIRG